VKPRFPAWAAVTAAVAAALLGGLVFLWVIGVNPPSHDAAEYDRAAARLAAGLGLTYENGRLSVDSHPPLYPVFLGGVYAVGGGAGGFRLVQLCLALFTLVLANLAARPYLDAAAARAALVAGAFYLPWAFYATQLMSETLFTFLLAGGVFLYLRGAARDKGGLSLLGAAGLAFGLAALTRGVALVNAAGLAVPLLFAGRSGAWRRRLGKLAVFGGGVAAVVASWTVYVYARTGHVVVIDTRSAEILYLGNNAATPLHHAWDITSSNMAVAPAQIREGAFDRFGAAPIYRREALRYMAAHPGRTFTLFLGKAADFWEGERLFVGEYRAGLLPRAREPFVRLAAGAEIAASAAALLLFWVGMALMPGNKWRALALNLVATTVFSYALTLSHPRYHFPLLVVGMGAVGYALTHGAGGLFRREAPRRRLVWASLAAAGLLAVWVRMLWLYVARGS